MHRVVVTASWFHNAAWHRCILAWFHFTQVLFVLIGSFGVTKWQKLFGVWQGTLGASRIFTELGQFHQDRV
jgi:hypothetical protein